MNTLFERINMNTIQNITYERLLANVANVPMTRVSSKTSTFHTVIKARITKEAFGASSDTTNRECIMAISAELKALGTSSNRVNKYNELTFRENPTDKTPIRLELCCISEFSIKPGHQPTSGYFLTMTIKRPT